MLEQGATKTDSSPKVKITAKVLELLRACTSVKGPDTAVFTRHDGSRVVDPRDDWYALFVAAGLGHYVPAKRHGKLPRTLPCTESPRCEISSDDRNLVVN